MAECNLTRMAVFRAESIRRQYGVLAFVPVAVYALRMMESV